MGQGSCRDNSYRLYSFVQSMHMTNADDCYNWCLQEPQNGFVGIEIVHYSSGAGFCVCLFSNHGASDVNTDEYEPRALGSFSSYSGSGEIQSSLGNLGNPSSFDVICYSYNVRYIAESTSSCYIYFYLLIFCLFECLGLYPTTCFPHPILYCPSFH